MNFWDILGNALKTALEAIAMGVFSGDALMMTTGPTCGIMDIIVDDAPLEIIASEDTVYGK